MSYNSLPAIKFIRNFAGILLALLLAGTAFGEETDGQRILETYTAGDKLAQPRLESIRPFSGTVTEEAVPKSVADITASFKNLTVKAYDIDGIHICDVEYNDGKKKKKNTAAVKKPLLILKWWKSPFSKMKIPSLIQKQAPSDAPKC